MRILLFFIAASGLVAAPADFTRDVAPLLKARCVMCHGPQAQSAGLRLDREDTAARVRRSGELLKRVTGAGGVKPMPPFGARLTAAEVALLTNWSPADLTHWAFQPLSRPQGADVDGFVRARLAKEGLKPSPEAGRHTLLRRLSLDLTGLPPTPAETAAYLADSKPGAYERQVDRLLASPHFGEKWARHWLDLARYADSDGYEKDWTRVWMWQYRDWVIRAFNDDLPFDQFTIQQIAGDMLPNATVASRVATGFHRNTLTNREGGVDSEQFRFEAVADRATSIATVWMGLTTGCAQCHNHKFDPILQRDYYQMTAFFDNVEDVRIDAPLPGEKRTAEYDAKRAALLAEYKVPEMQAAWEKEMLIAAAHPGQRTDWDLAWDCLLKLTDGGDGERVMRKPVEARTQRDRDVLSTHFVRNYHFAVGNKKYGELKLKELDDKLNKLAAEYPQYSQAEAVAEDPGRRKSYLRVRGDYKTFGDEVQADIPGFLPRNGFPKGGTRLDLAKWLVTRDNPLTARVAVNRLWQELFGAGIVRTPEDFGTQGEKPSHPELLDWLANKFIDDGWSQKKLIRLMVTSATYKQSSRVTEELSAKDPTNVLLARQTRLRLPAELIRDEALAVSGLLTDKLGGASVRPPQPKGVTELGYAGGTKWNESAGADRFRRGLYIHYQRTTPYPLLSNFDAPKAGAPACRRGRSNTALQALNLLNDPAFMEAAAALAKRAGGDISRAFELTLNRPPQPAERARLEKYLASGGDWTGLASILLNLDEFITRE